MNEHVLLPVPESHFEVIFDVARGVLLCGRTYGEHSVNFEPFDRQSLAQYARQEFMEFLSENPGAINKLRAIAATYTRSAYSDERANEVYDHVFDELARQWFDVRASWKELARTIARRRAQKLRAQDRVTTGLDSDQINALPDTMAEAPDEVAISEEERKYVIEALKRLSPEEQDRLDVVFEAPSRREAARILGLPESTLRLQMQAILTKIQPRPVVRQTR